MNRSPWLAICIVAAVFLLAPSPLALGINSQANTSFLPLVMRGFDPTWQVQQPINVQLKPIPFSTPFLILDSSGRPHILWDTWSGEKTFIYHTYLTGNGWTPPAPIAPTLGRSKLLNPPVAGNHNDIYLVWYNELNMSGPYRILYTAWDGSQWGPEYELLGQGKSSNINGMVRLDTQGIPTVSFIDSDGLFTSNIFFQQWTGEGFSAKQQISRPSYSNFVWLDNDQGLRFYGDDSKNSVHFSHWKNGSFIVKDQGVPGKINYRSSFLDGLNHLHLFHASSVPIPGGNVTGLYHQCLKNDLTWDTEKVITGQDGVINYSVGFNNQHQPEYAWSKNDNQTISVTFWNGCDITQQREVKLPPLPANKSWGSFMTAAENTQANKTCLLSKEYITSGAYWLTCIQ